MSASDKWPQLMKNDEELLQEIQKTLEARAEGDPYGDDGSFAANLKSLPIGLRSMAATHWLDVSLSLDSITWHFGNFGEPGLVAQTEAGLRELGLNGLAEVFCEARDLVVPLISQLPDDAQIDLYEFLEEKGFKERGDELDKRAWEFDDPSHKKNGIYDAWVRYTREHPERVFGNE